MLLPTSYGFDLDNIGLSQSNNKASVRSMYLGKWRNQIANKLNPSYFNQLTSLRYVSDFTNHPASYSFEYNNILVPVFSENIYNSLSETSNLYFSFSSESLNISPFRLNNLKTEFSSYIYTIKSNEYKSQAQTPVIQQYYAPGYIYSKGHSSFGVAAVLLQQKFLDDTFGSVSFDSTSKYSYSDDSILLNSNKGTGYQLSYSYILPANIDISVDYNSTIKMTEYNLFGESYSDGGDFDIPSQYSISFKMPISSSRNNYKKIKATAKKINYSEVNTIVHTGYSNDFFRAYNGVLSHIFKLDDLTVYSISYEQNIGSKTLFSIDVTSSQQAPTTVQLYTNILNNDTASTSYRMGFSHKAAIGEFSLFTSFANKPLMMGNSDFGRSYSTSQGKHIEGVASWSFQF